MSSGSSSRSGAKPMALPPSNALRPSTKGSSMIPRNWLVSWNAPCCAPVAGLPESSVSALARLAPVRPKMVTNDRGRTHRPGARERGAGVHHDRRIGDRAVHDQGAAVDGGRAGVGAGAGEDERARPGLAQRAGAGDVGGERERVGEVRGDLAVVDDRRRHDRAGKPADAEIERAAGADRRRAGGVDHAAVGDGERADHRGVQPQPGPPIASELNAFKTEPAPVTITFELPSYASPMIVDVVELTTPPLAMVSAPGPTEPSPTKRPKGPPTFQVEPGPVTVAVGVPRKGRKVAMSALPWLLSAPPLLMVTDAGAKLPMIVSPVTVTLEPAPVITALPATPKLVVVSVPPLVTVSVPPSTIVEPPTVSEPPLIVSAGPEQMAQSMRSPPMVPILPPLLAPVSVSEAVSSSSSEPWPANEPENVVLPGPTMLSREMNRKARS